jgi:hypothetical protein
MDGRVRVCVHCQSVDGWCRPSDLGVESGHLVRQSPPGDGLAGTPRGGASSWSRTAAHGLRYGTSIEREPVGRRFWREFRDAS